MGPGPALSEQANGAKPVASTRGPRQVRASLQMPEQQCDALAGDRLACQTLSTVALATSAEAKYCSCTTTLVDHGSYVFVVMPFPYLL